MKFYEDLKITRIDTDVYIVETPENKYLIDNVSAAIAKLNKNIISSNPEHVKMLIAKLNPTREKKRIFSPHEYIGKRKLCRLMLYLNSGCNMRCIYCHCDSTFGENMPDDILYKAVNKYYNHICERLDSIKEYDETPQITFMGGGEPFLRIDKIKEIVKYFNDKCSLIELRPRYVLVTNTSLGTDEDWEWLVNEGFILNLSLDGPEKVQNRNRPLYGKKPSFDKIKKRLLYLSEIGASVHVRSTVININEISEICKFFKNFSCVKTHALEPVSLAGRAKDTDLHVDVNSFYVEFFREYGKHIMEEPSRFKSAWFSPFKRTEGFCGAVYCNSIVLPDGNITLCSEVDSKETRNEIRSQFLVSNVNNDGSVYESIPALEFSKKNQLENLPLCKDCIIKYKCGGGCYIKKTRDFHDNDVVFYNTFCKSAISLNVSFMVGALEENNENM